MIKKRANNSNETNSREIAQNDLRPLAKGCCFDQRDMESRARSPNVSFMLGRRRLALSPFVFIDERVPLISCLSMESALLEVDVGEVWNDGHRSKAWRSYDPLGDYAVFSGSQALV